MIAILNNGKINMCLALPAQILKMLDEEQAIVSIGGIEKEISLALVDNVNEGDFVIVHVGYALSRLDESQAQQTLDLFAEMAEMS